MAKSTLNARLAAISLTLLLPLCGYCATDGGGLGLKTIVIDAGHGGKDPGCISRDGKTMEKDIALDVALKLGQLIKDSIPEVKVVYTRSKDIYLTLDERAQTANRNKADLFLSIHVNAADVSSARGFSSHILGQSSKKGRDTFAGNFNVCKRENSVILLEEDYSTKYQGFDPNDPESFIFFNLMQNAYYEQSLNFAAMINGNMSKSGPISECRGIHQDPFYVLWKTTMPSVLFEMAFISNSSDLELLRQEDKRKAIASAIFDAFLEFKSQYDRRLDLGMDGTEKKTEAAVERAENAGEYGILISTSSRLLPSSDPFFKKRPVTVYQDGKYYRYVVEKSGDVEKLSKIFDEVNKEFPGSYLVKIEDGKVSRYRKN